MDELIPVIVCTEYRGVLMNSVIITFILHGQVQVMGDETGQEVAAWPDFETVYALLDEQADMHAGLKAAETIVIVDVDTGSAEVWR